MTDLEGFLLAGGHSSRMGRDKARLTLDGESFVARAARALAPHVTRVRIVGRGEEAGLEGVEDLRPGQGPLAGIEAALAHTEARSAFVLACDMPLVTADLVGLVAGRALLAPDAIVIPEDADGRTAHLCGVYPRRALAAASKLLDAGERRPRALLDAVPCVVIRFDEYAHLPGAALLLRNVNTPQEYEAIL